MCEKCDNKTGWCGCSHHIVEKILAVLMWISAVLFFWTSWKMAPVWGFGPGYYFEALVVFGFLAFTGRFCRCHEMNHEAHRCHDDMVHNHGGDHGDMH